MRREPVLHAHHGESLLLQRFGDIAPPARQAAAVIPYDGREAFLIRRIIEVQPAHRVDVPVASGVTVSYIFHGPVGARPGRAYRAAHGQRENQSDESFHVE